MKKIHKIGLIILGTTILFACTNNHQNSGINLNNGEKWKVNNEMKPHIEKGSEILTNFIENKDKDYLELAKNLQKHNSNLIQSCTMKGESHDELHKWLHPHMELIQNLANAKDINEANSIISKIESSFKTYKSHFE